MLVAHGIGRICLTARGWELNHTPEDLKLTPLGRKLLGLDAW
ncbi:hypothetical protein [Paenibacillus agricola]|nr:hypothetical protein [Paenibacillus agricola]